MLPVWGQNLAISGFGWAYRRERLGGEFEQYVAEFQQRDHWTPSRMQDFVTGQLRARLLRAYEKVPYYRQAWEQAGIGRNDLLRVTPATLHQLPITRKHDLRQRRDDLLDTEVARKSRIRWYASSGTSGMQVLCAYTDALHRKVIAAREARSFHWAGVSVRAPRATIGGRLIVPPALSTPPFYRYNFAERQIYLSAFHIGKATVADYVAGFNRHRPEVLTGYVSSYHSLARLMLEQNLRLDYEPRAVILNAEKLTERARALIGAAFHARAYEEYGCVEQVVLATECEAGSLHVNPDFGVVEIVDGDGVPVPAGTEGRIVCTGLLNDIHYLIRYDLGDLGVLSARPCSCGRDHLPVLQEVVGRVEDCLIGPDGREMVRVHNFTQIPKILEAQIVQEQIDLIKVRVVAEKGFTAAEEQMIRNRISRERLGDVRVVVEQVTALDRTARGKVRGVVQRLS